MKSKIYWKVLVCVAIATLVLSLFLECSLAWAGRGSVIELYMYIKDFMHYGYKSLGFFDDALVCWGVIYAKEFYFAVLLIIFIALAKKYKWASKIALSLGIALCVICLYPLVLELSRKGSISDLYYYGGSMASALGMSGGIGILIYSSLITLWNLVGIFCCVKLIFAHGKEESVSDDTNGSVQEVQTGEIEPKMPLGVKERLCSNDVKTVEVCIDGENVTVYKYGYIYSMASGNEELYAIYGMTEDGNEMSVAIYDQEGDTLIEMEDEEMAESIFKEWQNKSVGTEFSKIEFDDVIVGEKEWKEFRAQASQEELTALAIGAKFKTSGKSFFLRALLSVLGTIASVVIGLIGLFNDWGMFGVFVIIGGWLFFNLMAVKLTSYSDTFSDCYKRLSEENKKYVDGFVNEKGSIEILKLLVTVGLGLFTLPFKAILMLIGMVMPAAEDWCIAHGGIGGTVITLPKGYDIGGLRAVGEYYKACSFVDAMMQSAKESEEARKARTKTYEYDDERGVTHKVYSEDDKNFYSSSDLQPYHKTGESDDGGNTIDLSKK